MNTAAVILMVLAGLFTLLYRAALVDTQRLAGPDRSGVQIVFGVVLFLRWLCLSGILWICVKRGGFAWPASREAQYFLVFVAHIALGIVSLFSGVSRLQPGDLSEAFVDALAWVPYVVPAAELSFALSVLFPDVLEPSSLLPWRLGSLGIAGAAGLAAALVLGAMMLREERELAVRRAESERVEAAEKQAKEDAEQSAFRALTPASPLPDWF